MTDNTKNITTTGEPVTAQVPATTEAVSTTAAPTTSTTAPVSTTAETQPPASTEASTTTEPVNNSAAAIPGKVDPPEYPGIKSTTAPASTSANPYGAAPVPPIKTMGGRMLLPVGYLSSGSMMDENGVMYPDYLEKYPQAIAQSLKPLKVSTFHRTFLTGAKEARKKKVPYSTKKNCAQTMVLQAMKLVNRMKDPAPAVLLDMIRAVTATVVDDATFDAMYTHLEAIETYMLME